MPFGWYYLPARPARHETTGSSKQLAVTSMAPRKSIGSRFPDFEYRRPDGSQMRISALWADAPALFVWLRHCG